MHAHRFNLLVVLSLFSFSNLLALKNSQLTQGGFIVQPPKTTATERVLQKWHLAEKAGLLETEEIYTQPQKDTWGNLVKDKEGNPKMIVVYGQDGNPLKKRVPTDLATQLATSIQSHVSQGLVPPGWEEAALYGFVGPEMYEVLQDFNLSEIKGGALTTALAVKGANVFGKAVFEDVLGKRIGFLVGEGLDKLFSSFYHIYHFGYKKITRRSGDPFEHKDIEISKANVKNVVSFLNTISKNASRLGMKAKVDREEDESNLVDVQWAPIRKLVEMKLRNQVHLMEEGLKYYAKDKSSRITLYALQIRDSIEVLISDVLLKTKSYKDLGEPSQQAALTIFASSLESDFDSLLKILPASKKDVVTNTNEDPLRRAMRQKQEEYGIGMPSFGTMN